MYIMYYVMCLALLSTMGHDWPTAASTRCRLSPSGPRQWSTSSSSVKERHEQQTTNQVMLKTSK